MSTKTLIDLFAVGGLFLLLDQWTKRIVQARVGNRCISWGHLLHIRRVAHLREFYQSESGRILLVFGWVAALSCWIILQHSGVWFHSSGAQFGLAVAFGGAAGNLLDILRWRYIVDFIDLHWWPVFNLADLGIVFGLIVAFWRGV